MRKTFLFVGHGRCGKDTACEYLASITRLRNAGTTSKYLAKYVAKELGVSDQDVKSAVEFSSRSDRMKVICARCRRKTTLTTEKI